MSQLHASLQISTQVVWGANDEELAQEVERAQRNGWAWDGNVNWRHTLNSRVGCAVLVSLTSIQAFERSPRLLLTRV